MGLFSAIGSIAGAVLGGGPGSAIGGAIGGALDQSEAPSAGQATQAANPMAPYQAGFAQQLQSILSGQPNYGQQMNDLMKDPSSVTKLPGYEFALGQGSETVQRGLASQGRNQSGAEQVSLQKFGQGLAGDWYTQQLNRLSGLYQNQVGNLQTAATGGAAAGAAAGTAQSASNNQGWQQLGGMVTGAIGSTQQQQQSNLAGIYGGPSGGNMTSEQAGGGWF